MKYLTQFGVVLAIALLVLPATVARAEPEPPPNAYNSIIYNWGSRLCLQPEYEAALNGITIVQQPCTGSLYQKWRFQGVYREYLQPAVYKIINSGSGQCLDLRDGRTADWSPVQQWTCNWDSTTMQWQLIEIDRYHIQFRNMRSGKCLDVRGGSGEPGAVLQIYRCTSTASSPNYAQLFYWANTTRRDDLPPDWLLHQ
jgi:hypothetical protein